MPKPPQAARSLRRYRGRARSRFAALCPQSQPTALPHTVTIPGVVAQPPTGQTSKSTRRLTGSRGPLNTGRDPYGDAVSVRLQIGTLSGFVSERRPASNRNGVRLQVGIGVRLRRYPQSGAVDQRVPVPPGTSRVVSTAHLSQSFTGARERWGSHPTASPFRRIQRATVERCEPVLIEGKIAAGAPCERAVHPSNVDRTEPRAAAKPPCTGSDRDIGTIDATFE